MCGGGGGGGGGRRELLNKEGDRGKEEGKIERR